MPRPACPLVLALLAFACAEAAGAQADASGVLGAWSLDPALTAAQGDGAAGDRAPAGAAPASPRGGRRGGAGDMGMGGGHGGTGGGRGGMHGGRGDHRGGETHADRADGARDLPHERGLSRLYASGVTIGLAGRRVRFDDGEHAVELDADGGNISGPGVGGTVALVATSPDYVVQTLTESGQSLEERYHLAADGRHLELRAKLQAPGEASPRTIVRVFDRAAAAPPR